MNARDLSSFKDGQFDFVIEKAMIDAILTGPQSSEIVSQIFKEVQRVLTPEGVFISFSHAQESLRRSHYEDPKKYNWLFEKH